MIRHNTHSTKQGSLFRSLVAANVRFRFFFDKFGVRRGAVRPSRGFAGLAVPLAVPLESSQPVSGKAHHQANAGWPRPVLQHDKEDFTELSWTTTSQRPPPRIALCGHKTAWPCLSLHTSEFHRQP